ncbi:hypothetical protein BJX66DRAFT_84619 [Aspergillus keveii]|uniref:Secreted protein n=1 Tax=Aspergillus keveii TaxID=714993 RepID=A0ABR4FMN9_9EURO
MLGGRRSSNSRLSRRSYLALGICGCACLSRVVPTPGGLRRSIRGHAAERLSFTDVCGDSIACSIRILMACTVIVSTSSPGARSSHPSRAEQVGSAPTFPAPIRKQNLAWPSLN